MLGHFVLLPVGATEVPVGKPQLLGLEVLLLKVEDAVVGNEGLEALVVMACKPVYGVAAERGTYTENTGTPRLVPM